MGFLKPKLEHYKIKSSKFFIFLKNEWTHHSLIAALGHNIHNNSIFPSLKETIKREKFRKLRFHCFVFIHRFLYS